MSKINYGKRYGSGSSVVSNKVNYYEATDREEQKDRARVIGIFNSLPQYRKENIWHQNSRKTQRTMAKRKLGRDEQRAEAEQRLADAVRKAVAILEFGMDEMMQHPTIPGVGHVVNQEKIHNVIVDLRMKCGVAFADKTEYAARKPLTPVYQTKRAEDDEAALRMYEQRAAREQHMRDVTERLKNRPGMRKAH